MDNKVEALSPFVPLGRPDPWFRLSGAVRQHRVICVVPPAAVFSLVALGENEGLVLGA